MMTDGIRSRIWLHHVPAGVKLAGLALLGLLLLPVGNWRILAGVLAIIAVVYAGFGRAGAARLDVAAAIAAAARGRRRRAGRLGRMECRCRRHHAAAGDAVARRSRQHDYHDERADGGAGASAPRAASAWRQSTQNGARRGACSALRAGLADAVARPRGGLEGTLAPACSAAAGGRFLADILQLADRVAEALDARGFRPVWRRSSLIPIVGDIPWSPAPSSESPCWPPSSQSWNAARHCAADRHGRSDNGPDARRHAGRNHPRPAPWCACRAIVPVRRAARGAAAIGRSRWAWRVVSGHRSVSFWALLPPPLCRAS